jgi:hypothetical protein
MLLFLALLGPDSGTEGHWEPLSFIMYYFILSVPFLSQIIPHYSIHPPPSPTGTTLFSALPEPIWKHFSQELPFNFAKSLSSGL